jgi:YihY family inner membrane protein
MFTIESHVYAMAIAASVLFGFFPFMVLILSLAQNILHWTNAVSAIYIGVRDLLPDDPGLVGFVERNLQMAVASRGRAEALSLVMLIFSANGIFMPLEVALNRLWGFEGDRSYLRNQLFSLGFTITCGLLVLTAAVLTSSNADFLKPWISQYVRLPQTVTLVVLKVASIPFSILIVLLIYWRLPNGKIAFRHVLPAAILTGVTIEIVKNLYVWAWPLLGFRHAYGPFFVSVTLLMWGFLAAMIVLAGAQISVRIGRHSNREKGPKGKGTKPFSEEQEAGT